MCDNYCNRQVAGQKRLQITKKAFSQEKIKITSFLYWINDSVTTFFLGSYGLINEDPRFGFYIKNAIHHTVSKVILFEERYQHVSKINLQLT